MAASVGNNLAASWSFSASRSMSAVFEASTGSGEVPLSKEEGVGAGDALSGALILASATRSSAHPPDTVNAQMASSTPDGP